MPQSSKSAADKIGVAVSIEPQKYFVEKIGNGYVNVNVMVPPGVEPHTFEPKPEQLKALSRSQVYFRMRVEFEDAWIDKFIAANPKMQMVDTTEGIRLLYTSPVDHTASAKPNPHIWLSPRRVKRQAETIYVTLASLDPTHQAAYKTNLQRFIQEIDQLDAEIKRSLANLSNRKFIVFHPAWGYFAADYNLEMIPVEVEGQEPSAAELGKLIQRAQADQIHVIFAEPQFSPRAANLLAKEINGKVLMIDPLAGNWANNLRKVAQTFAQNLQSHHGDRPHRFARLHPQ
jgi:zinc transport system substrate-binding protein